MGLWLLIFFFVAINGHIRLVDPAPRSTEPGPYPCGNEGFWVDGHPTTTIQPGKHWIKFEETIKHSGSPLRVALSIGSDGNFDKQILLDHIPHNDDPATTMMHAIEVEIPDIDCPKCSLQIYNAMTDGNTACCSYPTEEFGVPKCGSVYHSCANIVITGSTPAVEYVHEAEHICGGYAPGNAKTWNLVDGIWQAPTFGIGDLPTTCSYEMCSADIDAQPEDEPELPSVSDADKAKAHFILSLMAMRRHTENLEATLEEKYVDWALDTNDANELLDKVQKLIECTGTVCQFKVDFEVDMSDTATPDVEDFCNTIIEFFKSARDSIDGEWKCTAAPEAKRVVTYIAPISYTETDILLGDDDEARFVLSLFSMEGSTGNLEEALETAFTAWTLDTKSADEILYNFDTMYSCSSGKCEIPIVMEFTVSNTSGTALEDSQEDQDKICQTFVQYFITTSAVLGDWECEITKAETGGYWVQAMYSEGSGGLSGGAIFGIIVAVILGLLIVAALIFFLMKGNNSSADRV